MTDIGTREQKPPSHLVLAIVSTVAGIFTVVFCAIGVVLGAIAIVFAAQVQTKYNREDFYGAQNSSEIAFVFSIITLSISFFSFLLLFLFYCMLVSSNADAYNDINETVVRHLY